MTPTFASAAAGNNASTSRPETSGDWARRTNGATQTFRRSSHATTPSGSTTQAHSRDVSGTTPNPGPYVPPFAQTGRNGAPAYARDELLECCRHGLDNGEIQGKEALPDLCIGSWVKESNGSVGPVWGRRDDQNSQSQGGLEHCWNKDGSSFPLSLNPMTDEEKEVFASSVNSPIKPLAQSTNKDGTPKEGLSLRKTSMSQGGTTPYGVSSPTTNRPSNRRRDPTDGYPFPSGSLASPVASRFSREESNTVAPPPALVRRRTDFNRDAAASGASEERDKDKGVSESAQVNPGLKRTSTAPLGVNNTAWPPTSSAAAFSPMGAFGSFAAPPSDKKPSYGGVQGKSRFTGLMSKSSAEQLNQASKSKTSLDNLGKAADEPTSKAPTSNPSTANANSVPDEDPQTGGASLGGNQGTSPPRHQGLGEFATPHKRNPLEGNGFSAFGLQDPNSTTRDFFQSREPFHGTPHQRGGQDSPTDTNPYRSPNQDRTDDEDGETDPEDNHMHYPGMGSFSLANAEGGALNQGFGFASLGRASQPFEAAASDRSQTSSVGPSRAFPVILPGLGSSSVWPSGQQPSVATPVRDRGLGGGFEGFGEAQSPSLAGLGSNSLLGMGGNFGSISRPSRLESLFQTSLQEQARTNENRSIGDEGLQGDRQQNMPGSFGRGAFASQATAGGIPARDTASPLRRNLIDPFGGGIEKRDVADSVGAGFGQHPSSGPPQSSVFNAAQNNPVLGRTASAASSQPPSASSPAGQAPNPQERQMVMPDRMRWFYRDPNGVEQGPFTGLEMHDWYRAGFFSPELLVKKQEDAEFAPLAQLIRKIGNSREPFLVPQIGIPHGPSSTLPGNAWAGSGLGEGAATAQPPFANNFPTFGTTLTADQQNALERRKQEEQILIAHQKEHLVAQQQALAAKQMAAIGHQILPHPLQHHSSAHSLHSQPSLGSITSPVGHQPPPTQVPGLAGPAPVPGGLFDFPFRPQPAAGLGPIGPGVEMLGGMREDDASTMMGRLNLGRTGQQPFGTAPLPLRQPQTGPNTHDNQIVDMLHDRARLQREQQQHDQLHSTAHHEQQAAQAAAERLKQFHDLRVQTNIEQNTSVPPPEGVIGKPPAASPPEQQEQHGEHTLRASPSGPIQPPSQAVQPPVSKLESLSLTEQVQKAASAKQVPSAQMPWAKVEPAIHPFPPPPSQSPLPAPAAQRKPIVADSLAGESRSRSETPAAETPSASIAPWAKEPTEAPKGPSLREIQEAEARKAAEREAIAAAARREAMEKEMAARVHSPAAQPGLPSSSTWASGASPNTPVGGQSAWAKPAAGKAPQGPVAKKTLQQIQKEEEQRKQRAAAAAAANAAANTANYGAASTVLSAGKRYADLASKQTPTPQNGGGGTWTTVGASGKVKTPAISAVPSPAVRTPSAGVPSTMARKPSAARTSTLGGQLSKDNALEEFRKWAVAELRPELNKGIDPEEMVKTLLTFPGDLELITEAVHSASRTLDSRHFASEFLRRHRLAEKGVIDTTGSTNASDAKSSGDGWNEVAKKGGQPQAAQSGLDSGNFKVVAAKKKTAKR
ncbi:uncharacterized protein EI97DRAFT_498755 [Westerdykella ornata]|uniref:GYF domain-containing protein n=1 Tax=Westerdykella ornata TaxID=318751 RepID=A0A6A6JW10_WESOR|nr:uncharacterized protein EI97DRAFT_498755 [Westerdykella ornata]KAF2279239.1 hypothetical protein EI97DRAFT_498755 [Westerdykella ornata]